MGVVNATVLRGAADPIRSEQAGDVVTRPADAVPAGSRLDPITVQVVEVGLARPVVVVGVAVAVLIGEEQVLLRPGSREDRAGGVEDPGHAHGALEDPGGVPRLGEGDHLAGERLRVRPGEDRDIVGSAIVALVTAGADRVAGVVHRHFQALVAVVKVGAVHRHRRAPAAGSDFGRPAVADPVTGRGGFGRRMGLIPLEDHVVDGEPEVGVGGGSGRLHPQEAHADLEAVARVARGEELDHVFVAHQVEIKVAARTSEVVRTHVHLSRTREGLVVGGRLGDLGLGGARVRGGSVKSREAGLIARQLAALSPGKGRTDAADTLSAERAGSIRIAAADT